MTNILRGFDVIILFIFHGRRSTSIKRTWTFWTNHSFIRFKKNIFQWFWRRLIFFRAFKKFTKANIAKINTKTISSFSGIIFLKTFGITILPRFYSFLGSGVNFKFLIIVGEENEATSFF